jgi:hypothetical protein
MDEFVSYQTLACFCYPHSGPNVFGSPDASFYLYVLGKFGLPLLSYDYIGSLSSLLYAPFFLAWPSPMSARITGVIALLAQAWVLGRMFRFPTAVVFCCLLFYLPYSFAHIADTGPVAFQTTSVLIVGYLLRSWLLCRRWRRRALMMAAAGLMIALGCWVKPTYFFVSLGLAITALTRFLLAWRHSSGDRVARLAEYLLLLGCAAVPTALIYHAQHADGNAYLPVLTTSFVPNQIVWSGLGQRFGENVFHFVINPLDATFPCFGLQLELPAVRIATCLLGGLLGLGWVFWRGIRSRARCAIGLNAALFALSLLLVATNVYAKSMHHAVLAYPFILLAVAQFVRARPRSVVLKATLGLFVILNGSLFFAFPSMWRECRRLGDPKAYVAQLNDDLNRNDASDSVIACADWGIYFVKALYGPRSQVVLSLPAFEQKQQLQRAATIARRLHRNLIVVGLRDNPLGPALRSALFPTTGERAVPGDQNPWRVWRIPDGKLGALITAFSAEDIRPAAPVTAADRPTPIQP